MCSDIQKPFVAAISNAKRAVASIQRNMTDDIGCSQGGVMGNQLLYLFLKEGFLEKDEAICGCPMVEHMTSIGGGIGCLSSSCLLGLGSDLTALNAELE